MKDYVPDALSELADALANPIAYQSMIEKRAKQLEALTEDDQLESGLTDGDDTGLDGGAFVGESGVDDANPDDDQEEASVASISRRMRTVKQLFSSSGPSSSVSSVPSAGSAALQTANESRDSVCSLGNGAAGAGGTSTGLGSGSTTIGGTGAHPHGVLLRQDTQPRSRDGMGEFGVSLLRAPSLLESEQAVGLAAESLGRLRESKRVLKVQTEMDRELSALIKKHSRQLDKELALLVQKRDKILAAQNKSRSLLAKTNSKLTRKSVSSDNRYVFVCGCLLPYLFFSRIRFRFLVFILLLESLEFDLICFNLN